QERLQCRSRRCSGGVLSGNIDSTTLRALITKNGNEVFRMPKVKLESAYPERNANPPPADRPSAGKPKLKTVVTTIGSRRTTVTSVVPHRDSGKSGSGEEPPVALIEEDPAVAEYFAKHPKLVLREMRLRPDRGPSWLGVENRANPFQEIPI